MIEIIYNETKKGTTGNEEIFHIPNNIRQIGESKNHLKIYMEDYAYTFLKRIARQDTETGCAAILLGEAKWRDSISYIFVKSALKIEGAEITAEHMPFNDGVWGEVHKEIETHFPDQEIIGWALSLPGFNMKINDIIQRTHLDHFAGSQKTLFVMEPNEKEESFFVYENNQMNRQSGYYIYYEKNEPMQSYMIEKNGNSSIEETERTSDRAVLDFRKIVTGKKEEKKSEGASKRLLYGVSACSVIALLAFGITFFNNYTNMKSAVGKVTQKEEQDTSQVSNIEAAKTPLPDSDTTATPAPKETSDQDEAAKTDDKDVTVQNTDKTNNSNSNSDAEPDSGGNKTAQENASADDLLQNTPTETPEAQKTPADSSAYRQYVVKRGDTLTHISENNYGSIKRIEEICEINNMTTEDIIYEGQIILLP